MRKLMILVASVFAVFAAACGSSTSSTEDTTTTAASTSSTAAGHSGGSAPKIEHFEVAHDVSCTSGQDVKVKTSWKTVNTTKVKIEVNGSFVRENEPAEGSTEVTVKCDGQSHRVALEALNASGEKASDAHSVKTEPGGSGGATPKIDSFSVSLKGCSPQNVDAIATWKTENDTSVTLQADGAEIKSGLPASGTEAFTTMPCDGKNHAVTLVASGSGGKAHKSVTVTTPAQG
ncbi:MAG: hypothetical protein K1X95_15425 [Acidimicrobiia bacterium]|nr:hypothetical protein [Acidimicrobiia bacterium]